MLGRTRTAMKFFVYGLVLGLLFAPRSGEETRKQVIEWVSGTIQDTVKTVTGASDSQSQGKDTQPMS
jgi:gas vesicle protein